MSLSTSGRPAEILLVEDNLSDVLLACEGFRHAGREVNLHHVDSGERCLAFLHKEGEFSGAPTPDLVLLDINMPRMSGHEVMAAMLADPALCRLAVIALSASADSGDIARMYARRCNSYIVKPADLEKTLKMFRAICDYWFAVATLPAGGATFPPL